MPSPQLQHNRSYTPRHGAAALPLVPQETVFLRQTLAACTANLSHLYSSTQQQLAVIDEEYAARAALAAAAAADCVALFSHAFRLSGAAARQLGLSSFVSDEVRARRDVAEAEGAAFVELVLSTGLTKSSELGMRRALTTVRGALAKSQSESLERQSQLVEQETLLATPRSRALIGDEEMLGRLGILRHEGVPCGGQGVGGPCPHHNPLTPDSGPPAAQASRPGSGGNTAENFRGWWRLGAFQCSVGVVWGGVA